MQGAIVLLRVGGFKIDGNYIEFPRGAQFAISIQQSQSGSIANNNFHGFQGVDTIVIDPVCRNINIGPNTYGFFGFPIASFVRAHPGAQGISVLGDQIYGTSVAISHGSPAIVTSLTNAPGWQLHARVQFIASTDPLPSPLLANTNYFISAVSGATFQVSATQGGPSIATTSASAGNVYVRYFIDTPLVGDFNAFNLVYNNTTLQYGQPTFSNAPNPGFTVNRGGIVSVGNRDGLS